MLAYLQCPHMNISSKIRGGEGTANERNSCVPLLSIFGKVHWADCLGTTVNVVVCVLFLTMVSFFRKLKLKTFLVFCSSLLTYYLSIILKA